MFNRRQLFGTAAAVAATTALPAAAATGSEDARLAALLAEIWEAVLDESPEFATVLGLDVGETRSHQRAELSDISRATRGRNAATARERLKRLAAIDRSKLSPPSRVDLEVVEYQARVAAEGYEKYRFGEDNASYAPYSPYAVSQLGGPYQSFPDFLDSNHPVRTAADAEAWLSRVAGYPKLLDASTDSLRMDAAAGVLAPDFALDATIAQLTAQRAGAPADAKVAAALGLKATAANLPGDWRGRAAKLVETAVNPALDRQLELLKSLRAKASHDAGIWKIPQGDAFYADALAFQTTTTLTPAAVHKLGLDQVADLSAQLEPLLRAQGLTQGSVGARLVELGKRPDQLWPNTDAGRADLLKSLNVQVADMRTRLPRVFKTLPPAPLEIVRVPPDIQDGAPNGYATSASADGKRPGRFYINLKDTAEWPKFGLPTLTYHEALPGHQWQGAFINGATDRPKLRRYGGGFAAYGEGWALYAEQLAGELGVYDNDPLGRIGLLQSLLFRATRLVVDTGMHFKRWSREQATEYFVATTGYTQGRSQREIDRYCVWPGQACAYKVGHTEWERLRDKARAKAGKAFDIKQFHEVLLMGDLPLTVLAQVVAAQG